MSRRALGREHASQFLTNQSIVAEYLDGRALCLLLDCKQSLFFSLSFSLSVSLSSDLVRGVHARERVKRRSRETRETRAAARTSPVLRLQSRAWSFACLGRFARRIKKKESLLVVFVSTSYEKVLINICRKVPS